ncbi:hypothetical protein [Natrinema salifodinae]|uniref:Uncharacterized protein n=2 Tax=Natrinema salifodinae TaxID=1202768 RepID=A0A1I0N0G3_9EURY|nr:hypothetical protein [Natrinema salifodinae]SEV94536.1 hypothetical protein SAMN05216285_1209 [Natrinema salifodinae]
MFRLRPRHVAAGTALLGAIGLLSAAFLFTTIPEEPPGDGFAAGLTGIFVLLYGVAGSLALAEAGLLALVTRLWAPTGRPRRLLMAGALAGGLAVVLLVGPVLLVRLFGALVGRPVLWGSEYALGLGLALVPVGIACSGLGVILQFVRSVSGGSGAN